MECPKHPVVVVHGISDKPGDRQPGFSRALAEKVLPDQAIRDEYWIEAVWESVNNSLDDKIRDVVLRLVDIYDKTTSWRDAALEKADGRMRRACVWGKWLWKKLWVAWGVEKITGTLDLVLDLPMYLGNPKGEKIRGIVKDAVRKALAVGPEGVVLVGHSLGSVIAYDVLRESQSEGGEHFPVKALVTMGSPLAWVTNLRVADGEIPDTPFRIGDIPWFNFFDEQDPVPLAGGLPTSRFPDVKNEPAIRSGEKHIHSHSVYWQRQEVADRISELVF